MKTRSGVKKGPKAVSPDNRKCSKCKKESVELYKNVAEWLCPPCYKEVTQW